MDNFGAIIVWFLCLPATYDPRLIRPALRKQGKPLLDNPAPASASVPVASPSRTQGNPSARTRKPIIASPSAPPESVPNSPSAASLLLPADDAPQSYPILCWWPWRQGRVRTMEESVGEDWSGGVVRPTATIVSKWTRSRTRSRPRSTSARCRSTSLGFVLLWWLHRVLCKSGCVRMSCLSGGGRIKTKVWRSF